MLNKMPCFSDIKVRTWHLSLKPSPLSHGLSWFDFAPAPPDVVYLTGLLLGKVEREDGYMYAGKNTGHKLNISNFVWEDFWGGGVSSESLQCLIFNKSLAAEVLNH